jgi:glutathione peroxidase
MLGAEPESVMAHALYDFSAQLNSGEMCPLSEFRGKVLLIVNVASKCGFTPQYRGLQALHETFGPRGFAVLAFPCDQFGHQEPGTDAEIAAFCRRSFATTFPLFAKIEVNGGWRTPALSLAQAAKGWIFRQPDQMEFHKIPGRSGRGGPWPVRPHRAAGARRTKCHGAAVTVYCTGL